MATKISNYLMREGAEDGYPQPMVSHWCPACEAMHGFSCERPQRNGAQWSWDGNAEKPTMTPSMNIRIGPWPADDEDKPGQIDVCHYFLRDGQIQYCGDSTHALSGQTVALPPIPDQVWMSKGMVPSRD